MTRKELDPLSRGDREIEALKAEVALLRAERQAAVDVCNGQPVPSQFANEPHSLPCRIWEFVAEWVLAQSEDESVSALIAAARQLEADAGNALATETDKARWLARFREAVEAFEQEMEQ